MAAMDIKEIMAYLAHRPPFLFVDEVIECTPGKHIKAIKNVTINESFFEGHFPGYPVMPGVLIIEALAQVSVILVYQTLGRRPDDKLVLEATELRLVRGVGKFAVRASVGDTLVAEAELLAALRDF